MQKLIFFVLVVLLVISCNNKTKTGSVNNYWLEEVACDGYCDGTYCAEIDYYYYKTGTVSTYTLKVEIEDNQLVKIYWPNGGWLDNSHFSPPDISDGSAYFESDQGVEYTVNIIDNGDNCSYDSYSQSEDDFIDEENDKICPQCGNSKSNYDVYCEDCTDQIENTCSRCGSFQYYVYGGLCDNCQEEEDSEDDF